MKLICELTAIIVVTVAFELNAVAARKCCKSLNKVTSAGFFVQTRTTVVRLFLADAKGLPQTKVFLLGVDGQVKKPDANGIVDMPESWIGSTVSVRAEGDNREIKSHKVDKASVSDVSRLEVVLTPSLTEGAVQLDEGRAQRLAAIRENNAQSKLILEDTKTRLPEKPTAPSTGETIDNGGGQNLGGQEEAPRPPE